MNKNLEINTDLFEEHLSSEKISATRNLSILGALLYLIFAVADFYSLSLTVNEVLTIRGVVIFCLIAAILFSFTKNFNKFYNITLIVVVLATAGGIEAMIYLALPEDHASDVYFAGIILVNMTVFAWTYLKLIYSSSLLVIIIGVYALIVADKGMSTANILVNILFLLSAASLGLVSMLIRDRYIRENFLLQQSLAEALKQKTKEAKSQTYLANHDPLTDLPNRRYMMEQLEETLQYAKENNRILLIMYMDLNGFKQVNDIYGHSAGDEVLVIVAKRLELAIRKGDLISRLGGDEYLMGLLMNKDNLDEVEGMIEKFITLIEQPMNIDGLRLKIGASIGVAAYPMHGNQVEVLVDIADKKMYGAKKDGKVMPVNLADTLKEKDKNTITISSTTGSTSL